MYLQLAMGVRLPAEHLQVSAVNFPMAFASGPGVSPGAGAGDGEVVVVPGDVVVGGEVGIGIVGGIVSAWEIPHKESVR